MCINNSSFLAAIAITWATFGISQAQAEMGKAPAGATDFYLSVFGGYVYQDAAKVNAYQTQMGTVLNSFAVQDGGFVGLDLGFNLGPGVTPFGANNARIEASFSTNIFKDEKDSRIGAQITALSGLASVGNPVAPAGNNQEREVYDGSVALKGEVGNNQVVDLTGALEFFIRASEDTTTTFCCLGAATTRNAKVDARFYGAMVALQPEFQLGNGLSLAMDFAAGLYVVDSAGRFASAILGPESLNTRRTDVGFRGRLGGALKTEITDGVTASLFGVVDYWSDTPSAELAEIGITTGPSQLGLSGLVEAKAGARLTIAFGGN